MRQYFGYLKCNFSFDSKSSLNCSHSLAIRQESLQTCILNFSLNQIKNKDKIMFKPLSFYSFKNTITICCTIKINPVVCSVPDQNVVQYSLIS